MIILSKTWNHYVYQLIFEFFSSFTHTDMIILSKTCKKLENWMIYMMISSFTWNSHVLRLGKACKNEFLQTLNSKASHI